MDINFAGKTALVTGAGKGIGRATAKLLAKCGANVIALSRTQSDLDSLKQEVPNLRSICVDLEDIDEVIQAVETAGDIDLLVNNAAYIVAKSCLAVTKTDIDSFDIDLHAALKADTNKVVVKKLLEGGKEGAIVNISTAGTKFGGFQPLPYVAVKGALENVTKCFAVELAPKKIRVNCLMPGITNTPCVQRMIASATSIWQEVKDPILARLPIGRMAEPEEIAHTIVYLLSDKSSFITGGCIASDGGFQAS